jgi:hypothetical protein
LQQAANHELASDIAERRRNTEEMMRQESPMAAWVLAYHAQQAKEAENTRHAVQKYAKRKRRLLLAVAIDSLRKARKKRHFSRYARENRDLD